MIVVVVDHDNDCVRFGSESEVNSGRDNNIEVHDVTQPHHTERMLKALFEMLDDNVHVRLMKQEEGQITTIEEW